MTVFAFSDVAGSTTAFDATADVLIFDGVSAENISLEDTDGGLSVTNKTSGEVAVLSGITLSQLATKTIGSDNANLLLSGDNGSVVVGDDDIDGDDDGDSNTIDFTAGDGISGSALIYGLGDDDAITLGDNNENFEIFGGAGIVDTADGDDTIIVTKGSGRIFGNAGDDTVELGTDGESTLEVFGGLGDDDIYSTFAGDGSVTIAGSAGEDTIELHTDGAGNATADFAGDFLIYGGNGVVDSTDGSDSIEAGAGTGMIYGNAGDDNINLRTSDSATVFGGLGDDLIRGFNVEGTGAFYGNAGEDQFTVNGADDSDTTIFGGNGIVDSTDGADQFTLDGDDANGTATFTVYGNAGDDTFDIGAASNDTVEGSIFGGLGNDTITEVTTAEGAMNLVGGEGDDIITTGLGEDTVDGGAGEDTVDLGAGKKTVTTGDDDDTVTDNGIMTDGTKIGTGAGDDTITLDAAHTGKIEVTAGAGEDDIDITALGAAAELTLFGGASKTDAADGDDNIVIGGAGGSTATVYGNGGDDTIALTTTVGTIFGGEGKDNITGGAGDDTIDGGAGNDQIIAGAGANELTGGAGDDTFEFAVADAIATATTVEADGNVIKDFNADDDDITLDVAVAAIVREDFNGGTNEDGSGYAQNTLLIAENKADGLAEDDIVAALADISANGELTASENFYLLISDGSDAGLFQLQLGGDANGYTNVDNTVLIAELDGYSVADLADFGSSNI